MSTCTHIHTCYHNGLVSNSLGGIGQDSSSIEHCSSKQHHRTYCHWRSGSVQTSASISLSGPVSLYSRSPQPRLLWLSPSYKWVSSWPEKLCLFVRPNSVGASVQSLSAERQVCLVLYYLVLSYLSLSLFHGWMNETQIQSIIIYIYIYDILVF